MKITDLLKPEGIQIGAKARGKGDAINRLVNLQAKSGNVSDKDAYKAAIYAREEEFSTAVGEGIAIPHAKTSSVIQPGLAAMTVPGGVDWDAPDGEKSDVMFMIAAPEGENDTHLEMLAKLSQLLMHKEFTDKLRAAKTPEEFLATIDAAEAERDAQDAKKAEQAKAKAAAQKASTKQTNTSSKAKSSRAKSTSKKAAAAGSAAVTADERDDDIWPRILAITACPTGIAHTYMAAENLEKKAAEMGVSLKAETQGSAGAKNVLTAEEIAHADGIIIAADKNVERDRFGGKPVYVTNVSAGINEPEKLINIILNGEAPVQEGTAAASTGAAETEGVGSQIYKHLMNGVSHMLPFVIGGGILTAIAFLVDAPGMGTGNYGSSIAAAAFFKKIGEEAFGMMLPILAGYIAMSIADRPGLAPGIVGGLMAKAGYNLAYLNTAPEFDGSLNVSGGFIAALAAGFLAGYLVLGIEKLCDNLPDSLEGIKPILLYPLLGTLAVGAVMYVLNPVFGAINTALNSFLEGMSGANIVLLGAIVGGMMSIDMGGPFNKAAYVFGTGMLAAGTTVGQQIMAAVMVGGMVPPIVIALSTTVFARKKWSQDDRNAGLVNYIMGLSFISEGAIPFAAADPGRVLPSCIIGSAIAGAISAAFGCTSPAPHGGALVLPVIGNPLMFIAALVIGSVVGALILSITKKPLED